MRMYIPDIGSQIELEEDWRFELFCEYRNNELWKLAGGPSLGGSAPESISIVLPRKTILAIDRIYIRKNMKNFSSVSLKILDCPDKKFLSGGKKSIRFWCKLFDYNRIDAIVVQDTTKDTTLKPSKGNPVLVKDFLTRVSKVKYPVYWVAGKVDNDDVDCRAEVRYRTAVDYKTNTRKKELTIDVSYKLGSSKKRAYIVLSPADFLDNLVKTEQIVLSTTNPDIRDAQQQKSNYWGTTTHDFDLSFYVVDNP